MNFLVCDKLKICILNGFGYSEQYKKKSGNSKKEPINVGFIGFLICSDFSMTSYA